jgi:hypothetical protein
MPCKFQKSPRLTQMNPVESGNKDFALPRNFQRREERDGLVAVSRNPPQVQNIFATPALGDKSLQKQEWHMAIVRKVDIAVSFPKLQQV